MKIINDTEIFEPNECYFCIDENNDNLLYITSISFYEENLYLDDNFGDHSLDQKVIDQLDELKILPACEAMWETDQCQLSLSQIKSKLKDIGFIEKKMYH